MSQCAEVSGARPCGASGAAEVAECVLVLLLARVVRSVVLLVLVWCLETGGCQNNIDERCPERENLQKAN